MKHDSSTISWNKLGSELIKLAQTGKTRIHFIMPYMLGMIGDVHNKKVLCFIQ